MAGSNPSGLWLDEDGAFDQVEFGPFLFEVPLAALDDGGLIHPGGLAVLFVEHLDHFHAVAIDNADADGSEALGVNIGIVPELPL